MVEDGGVAQSDGAVAADGKARGYQGTGLRGSVELELVVVGDVAGAVKGILQDTTFQAEDEGTIASAIGTLESNVSDGGSSDRSGAGSRGDCDRSALLTFSRLDRSRLAGVGLTTVISKLPS